MCEPATIALASAAFLGKVSGGVAAQKAAYANAGTLEQNAQIADMAGGAAVQRGQVQQGRILLEGSAATSKAKAQMGASGVDVQSGSAVDVQANSKANAALDALTAENNAALDAWGYRVQASQFRRRATLSRMEGDAALKTSILGGLTSAAQIGGPSLTVGR